jgi:hypothetical protein
VPVARSDLDARRPTVRYVDVEGRTTQALGVELGRSAPTVLELQVATARKRAAWTATLSVSRDGAPPQTIAVDDGGEPFRLTSPRESRGYAPRFGATGISGFARRSAWDSGIKAC